MAKIEPKIDLTDPTLFGNDAAEDEDQTVFDSYFVRRPEVDDFLSPKHRLRILRAYKGEGKSAILRKAFLSLQGNDLVGTRATGSSLAPTLSTSDPDQWTKAWKKNIFSLLACEIGRRIGMAWGDDAMSLVEEAEKYGFKSRSFTSGVLDRLKASSIPLQRQVLGVSDPEKVLERWMRNGPTVWLFVDDVDENFQNKVEFRIKVASFFTACRHIINLVPEIRIRAGIRPNVWTIIRADEDSLGKVDQYTLDLRWDLLQLRAVLARRVEGYLERSGQNEALRSICNYRGPAREEKFITFAFEEQMPWGRKTRTSQPMRPPHVVMSTLSRNRPRWMIELCKAAGSQAHKRRHDKITLEDITDQLESFGRKRIDDTSAEFKAQCPQVLELINAFAGQFKHYTTAELHETLNRRVLPAVQVQIIGMPGKVTATNVAAFLYEIGFLTAEEDLGGGKYDQYSFSDKPALLHSRTNVDQGMTWEIHPVFRQALGLKRRPNGRARMAEEDD